MNPFTHFSNQVGLISKFFIPGTSIRRDGPVTSLIHSEEIQCMKNNMISELLQHCCPQTVAYRTNQTATWIREYIFFYKNTLMPISSPWCHTWILATTTICPAKPMIFTNWPCPSKAHQPPVQEEKRIVLVVNFNANVKIFKGLQKNS